jgi:hypothetical protein
MPNYRLKIDVTKLDKSAFFKGAKGTYVDITLWENDQPDEYGNTHSAKQDMGKERRGEKTPYIGNAKPFGSNVSQPDQHSRRNPMGGVDRTASEAMGKRDNGANDEVEDDVPFNRKPAPFQP